MIRQARCARETEASRPRPPRDTVSLAQAQLLVADHRYPEAARQADLALAGKWPSEVDYYDLLTTLEIAYNKTGQKAKGDLVRAEEARLRLTIGRAPATPASEGP